MFRYMICFKIILWVGLGHDQIYFFPWSLSENTRNKFQSRFVLAGGSWVGMARDGMPELQRLLDITFALWSLKQAKGNDSNKTI